VASGKKKGGERRRKRKKIGEKIDAKRVEIGSAEDTAKKAEES
jgi:hypothetical protein